MNLFEKGDYQPLDRNFLEEGKKVLYELSEIQKKYSKMDSDSFLNELRDSIVGDLLGYFYVNVNKHGFDCKKDANTEKFLEVKNCSIHSKTWSATFNDTNIEKAEAFKGKSLDLAVAIWDSAADLECIIIGNNGRIGKYLEERINNILRKGYGRQTQKISVLKLIVDYNFSIVTYEENKQRVEALIIKKYKNIKNKIVIYSFEEFLNLEILNSGIISG